MKNKLSYVIIGLLMLFSFVNNVFAEEFDVTVSASAEPTTVVRGEEVSIKVNVKSDSAVDMCSFKVSTEGGLEYISIHNANTWKSWDESSATKIVVENNSDEPLSSGVNVVELKYRANSDGKVTIDPVECSLVKSTTETYGDSDIASVDVQITAQEPEEDTTLSNIVVVGAETELQFSPNSLDYGTNISSPNFGLQLTASNPEYRDKIVVRNKDDGTVYTDWDNITYKSSGDQNSMVLEIVVNDATTYTLAVVYVQKELDGSLEKLLINGQEVPLEKGKYDYSWTVGSDVTQFEVEAILKDTQNFEIGGSSNIIDKSFTITDMEFVIIEILPKDSSIVGVDNIKYNIEVTREGSGSSGNAGNGGNEDKKPSGNGGGNATTNPGTGDISMFIMIIILISSLVGSIILYKKNLEGYE